MDDNGLPISREVRFSFKGLRHIEPIGVTVLANLMEWFTHNECHGNVVEMNRGSTAIRYLDDIGFFETYWRTRLNAGSRVRETQLELRKVSYSQSYQYLDEVADWLVFHLGCHVDDIVPIKSGLGEIFANINYHAGAGHGCICGQYYPNNQRLKIAVSDFGIGIPTTMRRVSEGPDEELILQATNHGVTSSQNGARRGAGLDNLVRQTVLTLGGSVVIRSGCGLLSCNKTIIDGVAIPHRVPEPASNYPGTLFEIELPTDRIERAEQLDLTW